MDLNFHPPIKNRSHRSENMYVTAGIHTTSSFIHPASTAPNVSSNKQNQAVLILAYLALEKNVRQIMHILQKL